MEDSLNKSFFLSKRHLAAGLTMSKQLLKNSEKKCLNIELFGQNSKAYQKTGMTSHLAKTITAVKYGSDSIMGY